MPCVRPLSSIVRSTRQTYGDLAILVLKSSSMTAKFEWDFDKDAENQQKHGVSFSLAQEAFLDPKRVLLVILHIANRRSAFIVSD